MADLPIIIDSGGSARRNDSEYILDALKLLTRPEWLEEDDGYRDRASDSDDQVTRQFIVPWSRRLEAREYLLGYSTSELLPIDPDDLAEAMSYFDQAIADDIGFVPVPSARLKRVIPMQDPERPWLFCSEVELYKGEGAWVQSPDAVARDGNGDVIVDPFTGEPIIAPAIHYVDNSEGGFAGERQLLDNINIVPVPGEPDYIDAPPSRKYRDGRARLRATFRARDYTILSDPDMAGGNELRRYISRDEDFGLEALPLARLAAAGNRLMYSEGPFAGADIHEAGVKQYPLATLTYTWHNVPDPPRTAYYACLGKVNKNPFDGFGGAPVYPAETLQCLPWKLKRKTGPTGRVQWQIQYRFSFRPQKWNRFPAGDGQHYKATFGGGAAGDTIYQKADFDQLFKAPPPERYIT